MTEGHCLRARESVDGKYLFYAQMYESGLWRLPLADGLPDGLAEKILEDLPRVGDGDNWDYSPGGLALLDRDDQGPFLARFDLATGQVAKVAHVPNIASPSVTLSPDGRHFLYSRVENSIVDLELVEGFR